MKRSLPLLALLAATISTPTLAQDMSAFLNPGAMAAQMGLTGDRTGFVAVRPSTVPDVSLRAGDALALLDAIGAAPSAPIGSSAYILSSPRPLMRPSLGDARAIPSADTAELIEEMIEIAPLAGNTAIVSGANTAVISGADTAVIHSSGANSATIIRGESPRPTFWQRLFGL